jgi:hypothetical protein
MLSHYSVTVTSPGATWDGTYTTLEQAMAHAERVMSAGRETEVAVYSVDTRNRLRLVKRYHRNA